MKDAPLEMRYTVTAKYGQPVDPSARFFVLSPDTDPISWDVLLLYAEKIAETHPKLSASIIAEFLTPNYHPQGGSHEH